MRSILLALSFIVLTIAAFGQEMNPRRILDECTDSIARLTTVSCTISRYSRPARGAVLHDTFTVRVRHRFNTRAHGESGIALPSQLAAEYRRTGHRFIFDGRRTAVVDDRNRSAVIDTTLMRNMFSGVSIDPLVDLFPIAPELFEDTSGYRYAWLGTERLDTTPCDLVRIQLPARDRGAVILLHIARSDRLPRRLLHVRTFEGRPDTVIYEWHDIRTDIDLPESTFALDFSADYTVITRMSASARYPLLPASSAAPSWRLATSGGDSITLESLRGKIVVLDFWATWCGPCMKAMPHMQKLHERYGAKGVAVIGVDCWEKEGADPAALMRRKRYTYGLLLDDGRMTRDYKIESIPTLYVIGRDGRILLARRGYSEESMTEIEAVVRREVGE